MVKINEQCQHRVYGERGQSWQCQKKAVIKQDGKFYCKIHSPEYIKEKQRKWQENFNREHIIENEKKWHRKEVIRDVCEPFTTEWLEANASVLKASKDMQEALKEICRTYRIELDSKPENWDARGLTGWAVVLKALAKAEGK